MAVKDKLFPGNVPVKDAMPGGFPAVMGIVNLTGDSFYLPEMLLRNGKPDRSAVMRKAEAMVEEGAAIIDIGASSSRPGSVPVEEAVELDRVIPAVEWIAGQTGAFVSVDTFRRNVAAAAVEAGARMINDISGGMMEPGILDVAEKTGASYVLMHMKGTPQTMQVEPQYRDVVAEVADFFRVRLKAMEKPGIGNVFLDPGFGFGKTVEHNYTLLKGMKKFLTFGKPILVGVSRKSMVGKVLQVTAEGSLNGTTSLHMLALLNGASVLRVHDVKEAAETIKIHRQYHDAPV